METNAKMKRILVLPIRGREREQMIGRSNERKRERRGKVENNEVEFEIIQ